MTMQNVFHKKIFTFTKAKFCMKLKTQIGKQKTNFSNLMLNAIYEHNFYGA